MANVVNYPIGGGKTVQIAVPNDPGALQIGQAVSKVLTDELNKGQITPYTGDGSAVLNDIAPAGNSELIVTAPIVDVIPNGTSVVLDVATDTVVLFGGTTANQTVIAGSGGLNYSANQGNGLVLAAGGNNFIATTQTGSGTHIFYTGDGNDEIDALSGNNLIAAGGGTNTAILGTGSNLVYSTGVDSFLSFSPDGVTGGNDTILATANTNGIFVDAGVNKEFIANGSGVSTVDGSAGSVTVLGGAGGGSFTGGTAGHNLLVAGQLATTLQGAGAGDQLIGAGKVGDALQAGLGNESLTGSAGADSFVFNEAVITSPVSDFVYKFGQTDKLALQGGFSVVNTSTVTVGGAKSLQLTLNDSSKITLVGVTKFGGPVVS